MNLMSDSCPDRSQKDCLSPRPVRVIFWLLLILIALLAIRLIDAHVMAIQRRGESQKPDPGQRIQARMVGAQGRPDWPRAIDRRTSPVRFRCHIAQFSANIR